MVLAITFTALSTMLLGILLCLEKDLITPFIILWLLTFLAGAFTGILI